MVVKNKRKEMIKMSLEEILKSQGLTDEQIQKVVGEMKQAIQLLLIKI